VAVSSVVFVVVLALLMEALISLTASNNRADALANNADAVKGVAQQIARETRGAVSFIAQDSSTSRSLSGNEMFLLVGPTTGTQNIIDWKYDSVTDLLTRCTRPASGGTFACSTVLRNVNVTRTAPVFRYFCPSGAELNPANTNGPGDIQTVGVRVRVSLDAAPNNGPAPIPFEQDAQIRARPRDKGC
jgi:hypothetical protein